MQQLHSHSIKSALEKKVAAIGIRSERLRNLADKPFTESNAAPVTNQVEARNSLALRWPLLLTSGSGSIFPNLDNKKYQCARKSQQMCVLHEKPSQSTFWAHILVKPAQRGARCNIYWGWQWFIRCNFTYTAFVCLQLSCSTKKTSVLFLLLKAF